MASSIMAYCSVCRQPRELYLAEETERIVCPNCSHSVPNFKPEDIAGMEKAIMKRHLLGAIAALLFVVCCGSLAAFALMYRATEGKMFVLKNGEKRFAGSVADEGDSYALTSTSGGVPAKFRVEKANLDMKSFPEQPVTLSPSAASVNVVLPVIALLSGLGMLVLAAVSDKKSLAVEF